MLSEFAKPQPGRTTLAVVLTAAGLVLSGCGGREAHPIASTNPSDSVFDCAGIEREFAANERQIQATLKERSAAQGKNVVLGVTGALIFLPALFFMDPKSPEKVEIDALRNRNAVLEDIARSKKCSPPQSQLADVYKELDAPAPPPPGSSNGR